MTKRRRLHDKRFDGCTAALRDARLFSDHCTAVLGARKRNRTELRIRGVNRRKRRRDGSEWHGCAASDWGREKLME